MTKSDFNLNAHFLYKTKIKQADVFLMAAKYKKRVPKHIYDALLKVEVRPF